MMGHTTINKRWGLRYAPFGWISNDSQLRKRWFVADEDNSIGWGRSAHVCFVLLLLAAAPYHLVTVLLATSDFKNPASMMACGTLTPVVVCRICMADLTFF